MHLRQASLIASLFPLAAGLHAVAQAAGNKALPPNPPSALTQPAATGGASTVAPRGQAAPAQRARVDFTRQQLTVSAENSSLNQILRDIGQTTGLKITGGVTDERVYGVYGPSDVGGVLTTLLAGSGSNIMILEDAHRHPTELVLTPRGGGPTPPNPNAVRDAEADLPPTPSAHGIFRGFGGSNPPPPPPVTTQTPPIADPGTNPPPAAADTTTQQSPNGVKTPQQVYDELLRLQGNSGSAPASGTLQPPQQPATPH